jgi:hypothetical protein
MPQANNRRDNGQSEVRLVVEVDGNPVGMLNLDIDRLWPLINHQKRAALPIEWIDPAQLDSVVRTAVVKRLLRRLEGHLYKALGNEMVKAELDVETLNLKTEAAAQAFGRTKGEIEKLVKDADRSTNEFQSFFWEYLLDDREINDLKKEWKAKGTAPR